MYFYFSPCVSPKIYIPTWSKLIYSTDFPIYALSLTYTLHVSAISEDRKFKHNFLWRFYQRITICVFLDVTLFLDLGFLNVNYASANIF